MLEIAPPPIALLLYSQENCSKLVAMRLLSRQSLLNSYAELSIIES